MHDFGTYRPSSFGGKVAAEGGAHDVSRDTLRGPVSSPPAPLERTVERRLLCAVRSSRMGLGIATGLVAASATGGVLVALGLRFGTPARPFNALAAYLLGPAAQAAWSPSPITAIGIVVHLVTMSACGIVYVALVQHSGGAIAWALLVAAVVFALSWLVGALFGLGLTTLLAPGDRVILAVVLAVALPLGMRLALSTRRRD